MRLGTLLLIASLAALPVACGGDDEPAGTASSSTTTTTTSTEAERAEAGGGSSTPEPDTTELYFTSGEQFRAVERDLPGDGSELQAAAEAVVAGPTASELRAKVEAQTAIPPGTEFEDVRLSAAGVAVVEVSSEFTAGVPASPSQRSRDEESELNARLGQVTYTLTQFPQVEEAKVVSGGEPVASQAVLDRSDYAKPAQGPQRFQRPRGEQGSSVRKLQARLAELRYPPARAVDGVAGYRTIQAVIAFHEFADVPTFPASHGCVRVPAPEAKGVLRFATIDTTVVVR